MKFFYLNLPKTFNLITEKSEKSGMLHLERQKPEQNQMLKWKLIKTSAPQVPGQRANV